MARDEVSSDFLRFLRIKHKVVQRLAKEVVYYQAEVKEHEATVARMKAENREPSDIKQQQNVLDETVLMVPDAESRLLRACAELDDYMASNRVCAAAVRTVRSGAAAHRQAAAASGTSVAAGDGAGADNRCQQQQDNSTSEAVISDHKQNCNSSSSSKCATGAKADGGVDLQSNQLNKETYEEVQKIFQTLGKIGRDLPHLHISVGAADSAADAGPAATEDMDDEDI